MIRICSRLSSPRQCSNISSILDLTCVRAVSSARPGASFRRPQPQQPQSYSTFYPNSRTPTAPPQPRPAAAAAAAVVRPRQMTTAPASFSGTEDASDMEVIPTGPILVISATGAILGQMTYEAAQEHVDPLTHQLRAVDTKQDPPVYRIIPLKAESSSGDFGSTYVKPLKNEKITASTVTVVDAETGETKGVMPLADALKLVPRKTHDLIMHLSAASEKAPTCQIISHEAQQKARAARKKPSSSSATPPQNVLKELEVGSTISQHDLSIKLQRARAFLEARHRLQFSIVDKKNRKSREILQLIVEELKDVGDMTSERVADRGRKLLIDFSPVPAKKKK